MACQAPKVASCPFQWILDCCTSSLGCLHASRLFGLIFLDFACCLDKFRLISNWVGQKRNYFNPNNPDNSCYNQWELLTASSTGYGYFTSFWEQRKWMRNRYKAHKMKNKGVSKSTRNNWKFGRGSCIFGDQWDQGSKKNFSQFDSLPYQGCRKVRPPF